MFKRAGRLPASVIRGGLPQRATIGPFLVRFGKNTSLRNRFAVIVGTKFEKTAVGRHKWQRLIREELKKLANLEMDVIVSPLPTAKTMDAHEAVKSIVPGFKQIKI